MPQAQPKARFSIRRLATLVLGLLLAWICAGVAVRAVLLDRYADYHAKVRAYAPRGSEDASSAEMRLDLKFADAYEDLQASNVFTAAYCSWRLAVYT
ncbi:hypothetical protein EDM80_07315 [bacterium]|nr:MAG: hypothetical protein EDM80_07315 [bacterium]RIK65426.1 MAG: hypothetical protein DCC64_01960 [Planctomycetota bacterium]